MLLQLLREQVGAVGLGEGVSVHGDTAQHNRGREFCGLFGSVPANGHERGNAPTVFRTFERDGSTPAGQTAESQQVDLPPDVLFGVPVAIVSRISVPVFQQLQVPAKRQGPPQQSLPEPKRLQSHKPTEEVRPQEPVIPPEVIKMACKIQSTLGSLSTLSVGTKGKSVAKEIAAFFNKGASNASGGGAQLGVMCEMIGLSKVADELLLKVCETFVVRALSYSNCLAFVQNALFPKVAALKSPASRLCIQAILGVAKQHPQALIDGMILPVLCQPNVAQVGSVQCEVAVRVIKEGLVGQNNLLLAIFQGLTCPDENANPDSAAPNGCILTDNTLAVMQQLLDQKLNLDETTTGAFIERMETAVESPDLCKSLKFSKLVFAVLTKYPAQAKLYLGALDGILRKCNTFLVKPALAALQKLR
jgi:hypothetical protein